MFALWENFTCLLVICYVYFICFTDFQRIPRHEDAAVALILARGGSKGIKLKNLSLINNVTLLSRSITTILESRRFERVWVSTDDDRIAAEAVRSGSKVHRRAPFTATHSASSLSAVLEFLHHHPSDGVLGLVQVTSPLLKTCYLRAGMDLMQSRRYNSVFTVTRQFKLRWRNHSGELEADNFDVNKRPRRQDWQGEIVENGMFYLARSPYILQYNSLQPPRVGVVEIPEEDSLEIDKESHLQLARHILSSSTQSSDCPVSSSASKDVLLPSLSQD